MGKRAFPCLRAKGNAAQIFRRTVSGISAYGLKEMSLRSRISEATAKFTNAPSVFAYRPLETLRVRMKTRISAFGLEGMFIKTQISEAIAPTSAYCAFPPSG